MRFQKVGIEAMAYSLPDERVSSEDLERKLSPLYEKLVFPWAGSN